MAKSDGALTSSEIFKRSRNWQNLQLARFMDTESLYDIPIMDPVHLKDIPDLLDVNWIGFNYARTCDPEDRPRHGLHFWLDDYQFQRLWADPNRYIDMLKQFRAVMSPDFSVYNDFPRAIKIYNVYRNMWLAAYWQYYGITVIPTIMWGSPDTWDYCLSGYPVGSVVAISSEGNFMSRKNTENFLSGYQMMLDRLQPEAIILHGRRHEKMGGNIVQTVQTFTQKMKNRVYSCDNGQGDV